MEFVMIPAGEFDMGAPFNEPGGKDTESPVHHVKISYSFYMGKYEVTAKQWREGMGIRPPYDLKYDELPVRIGWDDAQDFIKKLNEKEGGNKYRLPTEAEWEYAARAGTTTRFSFGNDGSKIGDSAWISFNSDFEFHPVGLKKPNPWGLYDVYGNVEEYVQDTWHSNYTGAPTNGSSWEEADKNLRINRVNRGCSTRDYAENCRSAARRPTDGQRIGIRLVMEV